MNIKRANYYSALPVEKTKGYCRAIDTAPFIYVGGTTSTQPDGSVYGDGDSYIQTKYVLEKLISFVEQAGGCHEDVVAVKFYATPDYVMTEGIVAYKELFAKLAPALTVVTVNALASKAQVVEIELTAVAGSAQQSEWQGMRLNRENFNDGDPLEQQWGFSAMVKVGPFVFIGGTSSVTADGLVAGVGSADEQEDQCLSKCFDLLAQAGASPQDVIKAKFYKTKDAKLLEDGTAQLWEQQLKAVKPLCTEVTIEWLTRPEQLVEIEMMAVIGCGGATLRPEWGALDLRRTNVASDNPLEEEYGYSRVVKVGPYVFCGGTTTMQADKSILRSEDSVGQESYIVEKLMTLMEPLGVSAKDVIKVKAYRTPAYKNHINPEADSYYAKVLKPVTPIFTAVVISELATPEQLIEMEIMAVVGCVD